MIAATNGDERTVANLLASGANVNDVDANGYTALHRASHCGKIKIVKALLAAGANVNARTKQNSTPLLISIDMMCPLPEVTMTLLEAGADVNIADSSGETAIEIAATESSFDVMREILKRGANPNAQGMHGETALHFAAMNNLLDRLELLLQYGARIDIKDAAGKTAFDVAMPEARKALEKNTVASASNLGPNPPIKGPFHFGPTESYKGAPILKFLILEDGTVSEARLIRGSGVSDIDQKLIKAYSEWTYKPQAGRLPIETEVSVTIDWR